MNFYNSKTGVLFRQAQLADQSPFEKLFEVFKELITHTSEILMKPSTGFVSWTKSIN